MGRWSARLFCVREPQKIKNKIKNRIKLTSVGTPVTLGFRLILNPMSEIEVPPPPQPEGLSVEIPAHILIAMVRRERGRLVYESMRGFFPHHAEYSLPFEEIDPLVQQAWLEAVDRALGAKLRL